MKEVFKRLIVDFQQRKPASAMQRDYDIALHSKKIVTLIGVRRAGKTYILYDIINRLRKKIDPQNIVYINFEDDRLYPLGLKDLDGLLEGFYELYPHKRKEKIYLFFDEIQNIDDWERYVRRIYDTENIQLFLTGSSAKLLSSEIATRLRGRTITYEIFPFSFNEYLQYKKIEINLHSSESISFIKNAFNHYLLEGGFAETIAESSDVQRRILKDYLDLIIYKDVVERYRVKNQTLLKHLIKHLFVNMSTLLSVNKLYNDYKSQGFKVSKDTLYEYLGFLQDSYSLFSVPIYRNSVAETQRNPKKIYAIDNGFKQLFGLSLSDDFSKLYENMAFLNLRRQTDKIFYFKNVQEVDLYAELDKKYLVNVAYHIDNKKTLDREVKALLEGMAYFNVQQAFLISDAKEEMMSIKGKNIQIMPMWKWLIAKH